MQKGYFFCGDLLGFANIIKNLTPDELDKKMQRWVSLVGDIAARNDIKKIQLISDTVFASVDDDKTELRKLVNFARDLLNTCTPESLLVRGAIVRGDFTFEESFVYGNAVIRSHDLEKQQDWIGVTIDSDDHLNEEDYVNMDLICYAVPMKNMEIRLYPALNWTIPQYDILSKYTTLGGLTYDKEPLGWIWGTKMQNTVLFNLYIKFIRDNNSPPHLVRGGLSVHWLDVMMHNPVKIQVNSGEQNN